MFEVKYNTNVPEQDHHEFIYSKGHKVPKHDNGLRYAYLDGNGFLHCTKWEDFASKYGGGVYAVTDEIDCEGGLPAVDGKTYEVWGADDCTVKLSNDSDEKFHTKREETKNKVVVPHNDKTKTAALEVLREMYLAIKAKRDEIGEA